MISKKVDLVGINNGAYYEFMKVVSDRFATEAALSTNAAAKKAIEALAAAVKEEDRCLVVPPYFRLCTKHKNRCFYGQIATG